MINVSNFINHGFHLLYNLSKIELDNYYYISNDRWWSSNKLDIKRNSIVRIALIHHSKLNNDRLYLHLVVRYRNEEAYENTRGWCVQLILSPYWEISCLVKFAEWLTRKKVILFAEDEWQWSLVWIWTKLWEEIDINKIDNFDIDCPHLDKSRHNIQFINRNVENHQWDIELIYQVNRSTYLLGLIKFILQ